MHGVKKNLKVIKNMKTNTKINEQTCYKINACGGKTGKMNAGGHVGQVDCHQDAEPTEQEAGHCKTSTRVCPLWNIAISLYTIIYSYKL